MKLTNDAEIQIFVSTHPHLSLADKDLARALAAKGYADAYTLRQRLQGLFPAQLAHGSTTAMEPLLEILRQHNRPHKVLPRCVPLFDPEPIKDLSIFANRVELRSQTQTICCHPDEPLLAIVADISGRIRERQLKRMLVRHTYGVSTPDTTYIETLEREIFRLSPVLDLYRLNKSGGIEAGIRILPGKFDHRQLADSASLSRQQNLQTLWHKIREAASNAKIHYSFGIAFLPTCTPETVTEQEAYSMQDNFRALTHYAWLMAELEHSDTAVHNSSSINNASIFTPLAFHSTVKNTTPEHRDSTSIANKGSEKIDTKPATNSLPQPPEPEIVSGLKLYANGWRILLIASVVAGAGWSQVRPGFEVKLLSHLFSSGTAQALLGILCFGAAAKYVLLKRRIENTPTSKIRSLAMGMVEVHGRVVRKYALISPVSGLPCVYYQIKKYKRKRFYPNRRLLSRHGDNQWTLVSVTSSSTVPFMLHDESGAVQVNPAGANIKVRTSHTGTGTRARLPFSVGETQNDNERWEEKVIPAGSYVYILGFAKTQDEPHSQKETLRQALHNLKHDQVKLKEFDTNGDGHIDTKEWDQARHATEQQLLIQQLSQDTHTKTQTYITHPPGHNYPFLIAETESELHLTRKFMYYGGLLSVVGLGLVIWGLYAAC